MKTTIDVPDTLLQEAKIAAARRRTTLRTLVIEGLKQVTHPSYSPPTTSQFETTDDPAFVLDSFGLPVLKKGEVKVTNDLIERLREAEGV